MQAYGGEFSKIIRQPRQWGELGTCSICRCVFVTGGRIGCSVREIYQKSDAGCGGCTGLRAILEPHVRKVNGSQLQIEIKTRLALLETEPRVLKCTLATRRHLHRHVSHDGLIVKRFDVVLSDLLTGAPRRPLPCGAAGTDEAVDKIASKLRICSNEHPRCTQLRFSDRSALAARLIRITHDKSQLNSNKYTVRLTNNIDSNTKYACLSHCWGPEKFICTTKANIDSFFRDIQWSILPKTFQDAISFAFRLGLEYIWIDSLCICQDDALDWRHQGSIMDSIYAGAFLTLAAASSSSPTHGMFAHGDSYAARQLHEDQTNWLSYFRVHDNFTHVNFDSKDLPLARRAWTLQERLLSSRIVHFGPAELLWECLESAWCECEQSSSQESDHITDRLWLHSNDSVFVEPEQLRDSVLWHQVLEDFTSRALTYEKDIFPALQGIAKRLGGRTSAVYHAGLWDKTFVQDMLWSTKDISLSKRPKQWRAPTWSWASVVGAVSWQLLLYQPAVTVLSCSVTPVGDDHFGELGAGSLSLRGRCMKAKLDPRPLEPSINDGHQTFQLSLDTGKPLYAFSTPPMICSVDYDIPSLRSTLQTLRSARMTCHDCCLGGSNSPCSEHITSSIPGFENVLVLYIARCTTTKRRSFLALRCVNEITQEYERFGLAEASWSRDAFESYDKYLGRTETTITIV